MVDLTTYGQTLPNFGLANTTTGFATLFVGIACLLLCHLVQKQSKAWHFAWWMVVVTGIFTITLHGFGETVQGFGPRWFWAFLDTGSNIVVTWATALAIVQLVARNGCNWSAALHSITRWVGVVG